MNQFDTFNRITPALELDVSQYGKTVDNKPKEKLQKLLFGTLRFVVVVVMLFCTLYAAAGNTTLF